MLGNENLWSVTVHYRSTNGLLHTDEDCPNTPEAPPPANIQLVQKEILGRESIVNTKETDETNESIDPRQYPRQYHRQYPRQYPRQYHRQYPRQYPRQYRAATAKLLLTD
ncbi:hypothetical protein EYF80_042485 [Liparis tanakae]|uniref:Uncharacterized protein n=1 Tax=Liparis tanakae TaxID=230148 RepID=A0A4Z2G2J9_9TELE|nr:hypothetical protein EYF80_042485 [Liparis tanakae]